ncbi:MAG TPA: hypothetical protein PKL18_06295 [Accumulibacter sp.]|nr:hypothetical protein [Accumulibacter sp.]
MTRWSHPIKGYGTLFELGPFSLSLVELAGEYADTFALRGYDSVQLAAARILQPAAGGVALCLFRHPPAKVCQSAGHADSGCGMTAEGCE